MNGNSDKDQKNLYKQFLTQVFVGGGGSGSKNNLPVNKHHSVLVGTPGMI